MSSTSLSKPQGKKKELLALAAANGVGEPQHGSITSRVADGWLFEVTGKDDDALCKDPKARARFKNFLWFLWE